MRKPTIDELMEKVDSIYELAMLAAREATRLRLKDRDTEQPLQLALERIAEGKVTGKYLTSAEMDVYERQERDKRDAQSMRERNPLPPNSGR